MSVLSAPRLVRLAILLVAAVLLHRASQRSSRPAAASRAPNASNAALFSLDDVKSFFPKAKQLDASSDDATWAIRDEAGEQIGTALLTAPSTDQIVGYTGPNNLLVLLDDVGRIVSVALLSSGDTPAHVDAVRTDRAFWERLSGWRPVTESPPPVDAVSGSTLTSMAIVEAVEHRTSGRTVSRRFPEELTIDEVRAMLPAAATLQADEPRRNWTAIRDLSGQLIGYAVRTSPSSDNVRGYRGPTETVAAIAPDRQTLLGVRLRRSYDTPDYVDRVREDTDYLELLARQRVADWPKIDFRAAGIEGVSGATQTSYAVAEGLRRRFDDDLRAEAIETQSRAVAHRKWIRNVALLAMIAGALVMSFTRLGTTRRWRVAWQLLVVGVVGLWLGELLSLALVAGWSKRDFSTAALLGAGTPSALALIVVSLATPWAARRNVYCQHLCPHGIVQGWLGQFRSLHRSPPERWRRWLQRLPSATLAAAALAALLVPSFDLTQCEPFDAWVLRGGAIASAAIAVIGLIASLFVPHAYCRFGCPTGALLKFARSGGGGDRLGVREAVAGALVLGAAILQGVAQSVS